MATATAFPEMKSNGVVIDANHVEPLIDSSEFIHDPAGLRERLETHGYLYLPGLLNRDWVLDARRSVCEMLAKDGYLDPSASLLDAVWNKEKIVKFKPEYATGNPVVEKLLYTGEMIALFDRLLGKPTAHYDFTWLRAVCPGFGTTPHCDVVYMGRGETQQLFTVWTPLGDIDFAQGGLTILNGSHRFDPLKSTYGKFDVDTVCTNKPAQHGWGDNQKWLPGSNIKGGGGNLGSDINLVQRAVGGDWHTGEYRAGDALIFTCYTVHASLDNSSDRIRLSTDSRYQPEGTVLDERWVGSEPIAHSQAGKRGKIC